MNKTAFLVASLFATSLLAQVPAAPPPPPPDDGAVAPLYLFTADQLNQLLGPIALYPDPLIALILPASTDDTDLQFAAQYFQSGGDPMQVDNQPWDDSVKSLARYPQVIRWMAENLAWTQQLGEAFTNQPADVMNAIQRLRNQARAVGMLVSTSQQQVVYESDGTIDIVPTDSELIYVPYYDPAIVYSPHPGYRPDSFFGFSAGFVTGPWLCFGFDWHNRSVWTIDRDARERFWREHRGDWGRHFDRDDRKPRPADIHSWRPDPRRDRWQGHREAPRPPQGSRDVPHHEDRGPRTDDLRRGPNSPGNSREQGAHPRPGPVDRQTAVPTLRPPLPQPLPALNTVPTHPTATPAQNSRAPDTRDYRADRRHGDSPRPASPPMPSAAPSIPVRPAPSAASVGPAMRAPGWQRAIPDAHPAMPGPQQRPSVPTAAMPSRAMPESPAPARFAPPSPPPAPRYVPPAPAAAAARTAPPPPPPAPAASSQPPPAQRDNDQRRGNAQPN